MNWSAKGFLYKINIFLIIFLIIPQYLWANSYFDFLQSHISKYTENGYIPGISLAVFQGNSSPIFFTSGLKNISTQEAIDKNDLFEFGSTIKTVTASIILNKLKIENISINTKIEDILSSHSNKYSEKLSVLVKKYPFLGSITIYQLLNHTSGLIDEQKTTDYLILFLDKKNFIISAEKHIENALVRGLLTQHFEYANVNYIIIGNIIEILFNQSFKQIILFEVFNKFKLYNSTYYYFNNDRNKICNKLVRAYEPVNLGSISAFKDRPVFKNYNKSQIDYIELTCGYDATWDDGSAGGLISTVEDIGKFIKIFIISNKLNERLNKNNMNNYKWFGLQKLYYYNGLWYGKTNKGLHFWRLIGEQWGFSGGAIIFPLQKKLHKMVILVYAVNTSAPEIIEGDNIHEGFIPKIIDLIEKNY